MSDTIATRGALPAWHTASLVGLYLAVAVLGLALDRHGAETVGARRASPIATIYLPTIVVELVLAAYVVRVGRRRSALGELVGERWTSLRRALPDVAIAAAAFVAIRAVELAWTSWSASGPSPVVTSALPHGPLERLVWAVFAVTVGVSEELVFRGYLQQRFATLARSAFAGVALQSLLFGVAHLQQGPAAAARIALYGSGLGAIAWWRRSLMPCIVCHVATDLASGL